MQTPGKRSPIDILFLGGVFTKAEEPDVLANSRGNVQFAANALQWNLISGLEAANGRPLALGNAVFVGSWPRLYRDFWIRGRRWSHAPGASDVNVPFPNVFGVKHVWRTVALATHAGRWARRRTAAGARHVVVYSMHTPFIVAAALAKRIDPSVRVCLVVPDLPQYMNLSADNQRHVTFLKKIDTRFMGLFMSSVDSFVLLTRHMVAPLAVGSRPWIVVEGVVNPAEAQPLDARPDAAGDGKVVLYTGTLQRAYGILHLLQAFESIDDPELRLWICGAGEAEAEVREAARRDRRIRAFGLVSRDEALRLQRRATVLVNPRGDEGEFTRYSFPSKIMEYLLSSTPTIVRRLPGMPEEYFEHLFMVDGASPSDLARKIVEVCAMSSGDRRRFGEAARRFVIEQKNAHAQGSRILDLMTAGR